MPLFKGIKKTKSNENLSQIGTKRSSTNPVSQPSPSLRSLNAQNNQHLSYTTFRLSLRLLQFVCLIFMISFISVQSFKIMKENNLGPVNVSLSFLNVIMMFEVLFLGFLYALKFIHKPSEGRGCLSKLRSFDAIKVLTIESIADSISATICFVYFGVYMNAIGHGTSKGNQCPTGVGLECDRFNWLMTWQFLTGFAFVVSLITDIAAWGKMGYKAYFKESKYDDNTLMELRKLRMART